MARLRVTAVARERSHCNETEVTARWMDMLPRFPPKRIALVMIAGLAVLAAFCMHAWTPDRARPGEPARSS